MKKTSPFLPGISSTLCGRRKRSQLEEIRKKRDELLQCSLSDYGVLFNEILPREKLAEAASDKRQRSFPEVITFWAWIGQILDGNSSCAKAVTNVQRWYDDHGLTIPSADSSAYCASRKRLSNSFLETAENQISRYVESRLEGHHLWYGHRLKAIDGTSFRLLDTKANQKDYPQPAKQKEGCGHPVMGVVGILDLSTGMIERYKECLHTDHDLIGAHQLAGTLRQGDVLIGDRAYCSFGLIAQLSGYQVDTVMRLHQSRCRKLDWRRGRKLDANSRLMKWKKPNRPTRSPLSQEQWDALPEFIEIRYVRTKGKDREGKDRYIYLATTLLDAAQYPTEEIGLLYAERWKIEVKFRDIKTTMKMEQLNVKSPEMARKVIRLLHLAYNLLKALQMEAIRGEAIVIDEVGFKGTLDVIIEFRGGFTGLQNRPKLRMQALRRLEERIAERVLLIRPNRSEPRATKLRPKNYQRLTKPRGVFKEVQHRTRYKKAA